MNGALSSSSTYFGLASVDVSRTGTRSSVVASIGLAAHGSGPVPMQSVSQKHEEGRAPNWASRAGWSVNEYGDVRYGAARTRLPFSPDVLTLLNAATEDEKKAGVAGMPSTLQKLTSVFECWTSLDVDLFYTSPVTRIFKIRKMQLPA
ncbi:hypothetical protein R1flu_001049 [Riccia fluitans]|uniref:Uncharacterized protein n=1 Tax=Riccia fluitans TaxID=41844 RepID=A0ABD1Y362_9MARC